MCDKLYSILNCLKTYYIQVCNMIKNKNLEQNACLTAINKFNDQIMCLQIIDINIENIYYQLAKKYMDIYNKCLKIRDEYYYFYGYEYTNYLILQFYNNSKYIQLTHIPLLNSDINLAEKNSEMIYSLLNSYNIPIFSEKDSTKIIDSLLNSI